MTRLDVVLLSATLMFCVLLFVESLIARWRDQKLSDRIEALEAKFDD